MKEINKKINKNENISYTGIVDVSILDNDKLISKKRYHNNGTVNLFKFLANCIAGNYVNHEKARPCKIALYKDKDINYTNRISSFIFQDSAAKVVQDGNKVNVVFHFRIPYLLIEATQGKIVAAALWPNVFTENQNEYSANVVFNPEITIPSNVSSNWVVIVDWTLQIANSEGE